MTRNLVFAILLFLMLSCVDEQSSLGEAVPINDLPKEEQVVVSNPSTNEASDPIDLTQPNYLSVAFASNTNLLIPIAEYYDGEWSRIKDLKSLGDAHKEWTLFYPSGKSEVIGVSESVINTEDSDDPYAGFKTSYSPESLRKTPYSSANVAFTEKVDFIRYEEVDSTAILGIYSAIASRFETEEEHFTLSNNGLRTTKNGIVYVGGIPEEYNLRKSSPIKFQIFAPQKPLDSRTPIYFEAHKKYNCWESTLSGWLIKEEEEFYFLSLGNSDLFRVMECESKAKINYRFHGVFEWDNQVLVLASWSSWSSSGSEILRIEKDSTRFVLDESYYNWVMGL